MARPRSKERTAYWRCIEPGFAQIGDTPYYFKPGDTIEDGHPLLKSVPNSFVPMEPNIGTATPPIPAGEED